MNASARCTIFPNIDGVIYIPREIAYKVLFRAEGIEKNEVDIFVRATPSPKSSARAVISNAEREINRRRTRTRLFLLYTMAALRYFDIIGACFFQS